MQTNFGPGAWEEKVDANEAIHEIPQNRTLIAQKLTEETPLKPELVGGLTTVEEVFEHFKPEIKVNFEDVDGVSKMETLKFRNLGDFGIKGITAQSKFLTDLETEKDQYQKIMRQLKTNKLLKSALENPEVKQAILETIELLIKEIDQK